MTDTVMLIKDHNAKLTVKQLAEALYEGTPHLQNLAEKLARQHGKAGALTFFNMMGSDVQNFFMNIAQQLIDFGKGWEANQGSACSPSKELRLQLAAMPRHPELIVPEHEQEHKNWVASITYGQYKSLLKAYNTAVANKEPGFEWNGNPMSTDYVKYVLEFLEPKFKDIK